MICDVNFGGLLKIACETMPADLANWLMVHCFDAESSELVLPGRGRIPVTEESVSNILELPNKGGEVKYELDVEAINFVHNKYGIVEGTAPKIDAIVERVKKNKLANEDFLRSWLMIAVSTFLCPPTSLGISPRCYPALVDLSSVNKLNWCKFVVDQLKAAAKKMDKQSSVRGCLFVLVILYVDSLAVDNVEISPTKPRVAAWTRKLLDEVIKLDRNHDGSFGKLKLKQSAHTVIQNSLFRMDDLHRFVTSKTPQQMPLEKKRRLSEAVSKVLSGVTDLLGGFIQDIAAAEYEPEPIMRRSKRRRATHTRATADEEEDSDGADSDYALEEEEPDSSTEDSCSEPELEDNEASRTEDEENEPHADRLKRMQSSSSKCADGQTSNVQGNVNNRRSSLRLIDNKTNTLQSSGKMTGAGCSLKEASFDAGVAQQANNMMDAGSSRTETNIDHGTIQQTSKMVDVGSSCREASASKRSSWDFPAPDCDIMRFLEEPTPPKHGMQHAQVNETKSADSGSTWSLDGLDDEVYQLWEAQAIEICKQAKANKEQASTSARTLPETTDSKQPTKSNDPEVRVTAAAATSQGVPTPQATRQTMVPASGDLSITPDYAPPPRREHKTAAALQSPFSMLEGNCHSNAAKMS